MAIRFVASGSFDGTQREIEIAGFLTVVNGKLSKLRLVTGLTTFNCMRKQVGLAALN